MICGDLSEWRSMSGVPVFVMPVLEQLEEMHVSELQPGTYRLQDGTEFSVKNYETKTGRRFASHRTYADLSYIISGQERLTIADPREVTPTDYDAKKDVQHYEGSGRDYILHEGMFSLITPGDIHRTKQAVGSPEPVRCVLMKLNWNQEA